MSDLRADLQSREASALNQLAEYQQTSGKESWHDRLTQVRQVLDATSATLAVLRVRHWLVLICRVALRLCSRKMGWPRAKLRSQTRQMLMRQQH